MNDRVFLPRVEVFDEGSYGYRLQLDELDYELVPRVCPGLGGWKRSPGGWWTRVKGVQPLLDEALRRQRGEDSALVSMVLDNGGRILEVRDYDPREVW